MINWIKKLFPDREPSIKEDDTMKYLIAGLGNMGAEYDGTRHNIGFDVADALVKKFEASFSSDTHCNIARIKHKGRTLIVIKPTTYMNLSGKAVRYWLQKEGIPAENLLVVLDDLNLEFGKIRIRPKGSDGGHNGLKNIDEMLGNNNYARLRIGIGSNFSKGRQVDFVLGKWTGEEADKLGEITSKSCEMVLEFCTNARR